jgi:hypothetical protein
MAINLDHVTEQIQVTDGATNASLTVQSKGTGAFNVAAGSSGVNISNGGTVTAITRTNAGSGYSSFPSVAISAPTTAGGVQATASLAFMLAGNISTVASGGAGYTVGDTLTVVGGTPTGAAATYQVTAVSGGVVTAFTAVNFAAYSVLPTNPVSVTGGTGSGATLNLVYSISPNFTITNAGSGYVEQPTVTFSGGGGSGAAAYASVGGGAVIRALGTTGTQSLSLATANGEALRIRDIGGADSYMMLQPASGLINFVAQGGTNANLNFNANGSGTVTFQTNGTSGLRQLAVTHTASAVNFVQVTGAATGNRPTISAQGSDTNLGLTLQSKGAFGLTFSNSSNGIIASISHAGSSTPNSIALQATISGFSPAIAAQGTDTNIDLTLTTKGTGSVRGVTGGGEQFRVAHTASAVNFVQVTGAATGGATRISTQGSDSLVSLGISSKGAGDIFFQNSGSSATGFIIKQGSGSIVNHLQVTSSATGVAPVLSAQGSDTNIGLSLTAKGAGDINFFANSNDIGFKVSPNGTTGNSWVAYGSSVSPVLEASGSATNVNGIFRTKGSGIMVFRTNTSDEQLRINPTASAVNYVQVTGATTGGAPTFSSQGSDTNINMAFVSKGSGGFRFFSQAGGARQFQINNTTSAVNYPIVTGAAAGGTPVLSVDGSDTDIDIRFTPKGAGFVRFGTYTAGALSIAGYIEIRDAGGTIRRLAVVA